LAFQKYEVIVMADQSLRVLHAAENRSGLRIAATGN
jgi:hypothetical protein